MKCKRLLKFYFYADALNAALDRLISAVAVKSYEAGAGYQSAEKIMSVIDAKDELSKLWRYLDGVMNGLNESDIETLRYYGGLRVGSKSLGEDAVREIKRAVSKFTRRARFIGRFDRAVSLVREYYCLLDSSV